MSVILDIVHPAHVHFFRHMYEHLVANGIEVRVLARDKDVTHALLDGFGIPYESHGRSGDPSRIVQLRELVGRVSVLSRMIRDSGADLVLTRNPAGVQAARLMRRTGVFDTDDGRAAGVHFAAARPFAHVITTPTSITDDYGARHRKYNGYKALAYLHPNHFRADPAVFEDLGLAQGTPFSIVRFVDMAASHDHGETGLAADSKRRIVADLAEAGPVFVSSEGELPADIDGQPLSIPPHRMHDALAFSTCYVGDSQTMAAEAALLGVPSFQISSWSRRLAYLAELQDDFGLVESFRPERAEEARVAIATAIGAGGSTDRRQASLQRLYQEKADVAGWYQTLVHEILGER